MDSCTTHESGMWGEVHLKDLKEMWHVDGFSTHEPGMGGI